MAEANSNLSDNEDENLIEASINGSVASVSTSGKRDRLNDSGVDGSVADSLNDEYNKKVKRELASDSLSSPNSTNKNKRHQRNYRPRVMESGSDEENNSSHTISNVKENGNCEMPEFPNENALNGNSSVQIAKNSNESDVNNATLSPVNNSVDCSSNTNGLDGDADLSSCNSSRNRTIDTSTVNFTETSVSSGGAAGGSSTSNANDSTGSRRARRFFRDRRPELDSETSSDSDDDVDRRERTEDDKTAQRIKLEENTIKEFKIVMGKRKPKHKWNSTIATINRQYGMPGNRQSSTLFAHHYYDSLHVAQRLELVSKLEYHTGCTNALNFSDSGDLLASSSDDLQIAIWDWSKQKTCVTYNSGHKNNVFQCKFLPLSGNTHIVSCARDGQVRLAEISSAGVCQDTRRLAKHSRSAHKLTVRLSTPYEIMSAGEDAYVYNIDIRSDQPNKIVLVKDVHGKKVPLYSIHQHPLNDDQFCVSGQDEYVRIYDRRIISPLGPPVLKFCPNHLIDKKPKSTITCAVYSNNGDAILASYNDDDIYLFDTSLSEGAAPAHRYAGHRNNSTVKGVNFFSPSSQFVVSGSDCGNIFIWDRESEAIVNWMHGDDNGVVNVLEPHPHIPVLATSGLDSDIKLWIPKGTDKPKLANLPSCVRTNIMRRLREGSDENQSFDTHMLMMLFQHLRRNSSGRRTTRSGDSPQHPNPEEEELDLPEGEFSANSTSNSESEDDLDVPSRDVVQCATH